MFTGLFRRRDNESPITSTTPLDAQKQLQIESLRRHNPSVCEILKYVSYRLDIFTASGQIFLDILLPPLFPQVKPIITISSAVYHPWVDDQQRIVGCPELLNFSMHSDLGRLVLSIVEEFHKNPPVVLGHSQSKLGNEKLVNGSQVFPSTVPNAIYTPGSGKTTLHLPFTQGSSYLYESNQLPSSFPQLKELSKDELQTLNTDDDKLQDFIDNLPVMEKLSNEKDELSQINESLAVENLSKRPVLEEYKNGILEMADKATTLRKEFDEYSYRHQILSEQYLPGTIQENLKFAALQAEEDSEKVAEMFLDGNMEIEDFLSKFMEKRTLGHCRRAKEEKLHQQLMELKKSGF